MAVSPALRKGKYIVKEHADPTGYVTELLEFDPVEVKSGKDYTVHSALNNLLNNPDYNIPTATVFSNEREIYEDGKVTYMPVYLVMFIKADNPQVDDTEYLF